MALFALFLSVHIVSASAVIDDRKQLTEKSVTVYPQVLEARDDGSEKVLIVHEGYRLHLRKASILAGRLLLRDVTEDGVIERYVDGAHYERHLYEDASKKASLLLKPSEHDDYFVTGLVNFTHRIEPVMLRERTSVARTAHKILPIDNLQGSCENDQAIESEFYIVDKNEMKSGFREASPPEVEMRGAIPQKFGIELHFISDYNHSKHFEGRTDDHVMYVTLFMHSQLVSPQRCRIYRNGAETAAAAEQCQDYQQC
ncbi:uncharacterized protein LOC119465018 [Dermacentor silvarum]|uniref:uncharacterized protein LOC119465018 n=1 Tax=Dermacentor silvarum TaxID=543639 RepID=UPI0021006B63|nr:uncharacterized protein LOC119465018 [Dermacentor silvarum]